MYYFLYKVNNINMKKILLIISLLFCIKVKAIENITINNENLSPVFNSDIKVYNYFTYSDSINIQVKSKENEQVTGSGVFSLNDDLTTFKVTSNDKEYTINVFKSEPVSKVEKVNTEVKSMSYIKKEIVKFIIITISCTLIFLFYRLIFISKFTLNVLPNTLHK